MACAFREGTLVQLRDGTKAQLVSFNRQESQWLATTFDGIEESVSADSVTPLRDEDIPDLDLVIGPKRDEQVMAQEMMGELINKGYCVSHYIVPQGEVSQMREAAQTLKYSRVPLEFEPYYLGRDSKEKTVLIDFDSDDVSSTVVKSPLSSQDNNMGNLCGVLSPYLEECLGIRITSRTNLMIRMTFADEEEEMSFPGQADPTDAEREAFLSLMKRKRVCMMQFLGPLTGELTLIPKGEGGGGEVTIKTAPGTMVVFLTERFQYSHSCPEGETMTLQTWFLGQRPEFQMGDIGGDMEVLVPELSGPEAPAGESVAVNGMATCLGGDSKNYECFWLMFNKAGGDTCVETPIMRWDINEYCIPWDMQAAQAAGLSYTRHQGFIDGIEYFDARFFGISNSEAGSMDPNQRKVLESTYESLNMGGYDLKALQRESQHIGTFVGVSGSEWNFVPHPTDAAGCGSAEAIISNRINFSLNLKGASQTINTACSAGLVAMHTAKLFLKYKDFDPASACLAAGINMAYSPTGFIGCCGGGMLSFKGRCFTYDVSGDGYLRGEGCSSVFINRAAYSPDIFGLVAGSQANQDGRSASITAPNGPSQEKCIKAAFREAGLRPPEVDCFECHGTGTALGDPIEVGAFLRIYQSAPRQSPLLTTSTKTNLGHLEGGAGMAGFIKCVLQVMKCESSPNLHLREQNPHLNIDGFPCVFLTEGAPTAFQSAYSGVSSFGFGGTNAHAMAYGKNTTTSRSARVQDYRSVMRDKIAAAPPPEITMLSEDPEDWESNGMPIGEDKIGTMYQVEIQSSGRAVWREVAEAPAPSQGESFCLSGSFNQWGMQPLVAVGHIPNLHAADIVIGSTGEESFHIVADEDSSMVYFPAEPRATRKTVPIIGPAPVPGVPDEACWCIQGVPGSRYKVEFFVTKECVSVIWLKVKEDLVSS